MFLSDDDPTLETLDFTMRIGSTTTSSYFICISTYGWPLPVQQFINSLPVNLKETISFPLKQQCLALIVFCSMLIKLVHAWFA